MNYEKITTECLEEMFKRVGEDYHKTEIDTSKDKWYHERIWTQEEEEDFKKWMVKKLKRHKFIRPEYEAEMFMLMWGWKTEEK